MERAAALTPHWETHMKSSLVYSTLTAAILAVGGFMACAEPGQLVVGPDTYLSSIDGKPLDADKMKRLRADEGCGLWMKDGTAGFKMLAVKRQQLGFKVPKASARAHGEVGDGRAIRTSFKPDGVADTVHVECWIPESVTLSDLVSTLGAADEWTAIARKLAAQNTQPAATLQ